MLQNHIIKQQVVDISSGNAEISQEVFRETSRLFNNRLRDISTQVFDTLIDEQVLVRLEKLEIDLGTVPFPFSEEELAMTYKKALEEALADKLKLLKEKNSMLAPETMETEIELSYKNLLRHYLLTGTIAWWASSSEMTDPKLVFKKVLGNDVVGLKDLLLEVAVNRYVRQRIVSSFNEEIVKDVVRLVEASESEFIFDYHKNVSDQQQQHTFVKSEHSDFKRVLWLFILDFLFDKSGSHFNRKMFVRSTISAIAENFNISFEELLHYFSEAIRSVEEVAKKGDTLLALIEEISDEYFLAEKEKLIRSGNYPSARVTENAPVSEKFEMLTFFLVNGFFQVNHPYLLQQELGTIFSELVNSYSEDFLQLFKIYGNVASFRKRIIADLGETSVKEIIRIAEPAGAGFIIDYAELTIDIQKKNTVVKTEESEFRQALWGLILSFLFSERGSVFNERVFLESNIRSLALHYNMEFSVLLAFLVQCVGQEGFTDSDNTALFYLLTEILNDKITSGEIKRKPVSEKEQEMLIEKITKEELKEKTNSAIEEKPELVFLTDNFSEEKPGSVAFEKTFKRNVLLFWFKNNSLPWWASQRNYNAEKLLKEFISDFPEEAAELLKMAIAAGLISEEFYRQQSHFFLHTVSVFKDGKQAVSFAGHIFNALSLSGKFLFPSAVKTVIALSVADAYLHAQFSAFDIKIFLHFLFAHLKKILPEKEMVTVASVIINEKHDEFSPEISEFFSKEVSAIFETDAYYSFSTFFSEEDLLSILTEKGFPGVVFAEKDLEERALEILEYFIVMGKLPDFHSGYLVSYPDDLIAGLVAFLFQKHSASLRRLLEKKEIPAEGRIRLHELFSGSRSRTGTALQQFISSYFEKDLFRALSDTNLLASETQLPQLGQLLKKLDSMGDKDKREKLLLNLLKTDAFRELAARHYKGQDFFAVMKLGAGEKHEKILKDLVNIIGFIAADSFERERLLMYLREFFFSVFSQDSFSFITDEKLLRDFIGFLYYRKGINMARLAKQLKKTVTGSYGFSFSQVIHLVDIIHSQASYFAGRADYKETLIGKFEKEEKKSHPKTELLSDKTSGEETAKKEPEEKNKKEKKGLAEGEQVYIHNAGLVLLHPFISTLFVRTGFIEKGVFKNDEKKFLAPHLLEYAVCGIETKEEHELVLNKILCGIDPHEALSESGTLSESDKKTADEMIKAIMQQWDKMSNTTVETFKTTFLQREGYIMLADDNWVLRVEQKAYDILLQTLPWSFGMIKFSWMDKPLIVEWT